MLFRYLSPEAPAPRTHPLRPICKMADMAHKELSPVFDELYSKVDRASILPEQLLSPPSPQVFNSIRKVIGCN